MLRRFGDFVRAHPDLVLQSRARFAQRMVGAVETASGLSLAQACHVMQVANEDLLVAFVDRNDESRIRDATRIAFGLAADGKGHNAVDALCDMLRFTRVASASAMLACAFSYVPILDAHRWRAYRWFWYGERSPEPLGGVADHRHYPAFERDVAAFVVSDDNPSLTPLEVSDWLDGCEPTWLSIFQSGEERAA